MVRKWTVRLPDDTAEVFAGFCAAVGITQQAALEASVRTWVERYDAAGRMAPEQWPQSDELVAYVTLARQIDAEKRRR